MNYCQFRNDFIKRMANAGGGGLLPDEYQQVEYLQSTGAQQINTDIDINDNNVIECHIYISSKNAAMVCGGAANSWSTNTLGYKATNGYIQYLTTNGQYRFTTIGDLNILASKNSVTVNDISATYSSDSNGNGGKLVLFSCYQRYSSAGDGVGRLYGALKMYRLTVSNNGDKTGDFIPCYRISDNKPGLYDLVTNTFFTNARTDADFTVGQDVL